MSWNAPQTLTEAINAVAKGFNFQSRLGVKAVSVWVLTDITRDFYKGSADEFGQDLIRRNWVQRDRYMTTPGRTPKSEDLRYVVGRDGIILVGLLRDGTILKNEREDLTRPQQTFRDHAVTALEEYVKAGGYLTKEND